MPCSVAVRISGLRLATNLCAGRCRCLLWRSPVGLLRRATTTRIGDIIVTGPDEIGIGSRPRPVRGNPPRPVCCNLIRPSKQQLLAPYFLDRPGDARPPPI